VLKITTIVELAKHCPLWDPEFQWSVQKNPIVDFMLSQMNPEIHFNINLLSTDKFPTLLKLFWLKLCIRSLASCMLHQSYFWYDHPNIILCTVKLFNLSFCDAVSLLLPSS
jgi:hypothetical protein